MKIKGRSARVLFFVLLAAAAGFPAAGEADAPSAGPATQSGEYVVYRDYSWQSPTWIGFLYYDDSTYGAFVNTPETDAKVSVLFRVETVEGKMILTGQNIISKIAPKDVLAVNYLMGLLPDLYAWHLAGGKSFPDPNRSAVLPPLTVQTMNRRDFGGDVIVTYAPEIPLFNLRGMATPERKPVLELVRMGRIQASNEATFFGFAPMPAVKDGAPLTLPGSRKTETRTVDGIKLKLDDQWTMVADNTFFLGDAAVLIVDTMDLSLLEIPQENLALSLTRFFSLSNGISWSVPADLSVTGSAKKFRIENLFYDAGSGTVNRDIKTCIPAAGKKCTVISLSVSDTAYRANKAYFDSLY